MLLLASIWVHPSARLRLREIVRNVNRVLTGSVLLKRVDTFRSFEYSPLLLLMRWQRVGSYLISVDISRSLPLHSL